MLSIFWCFTSALIFTKIKDDKMAVIFEQCLRSPAALRFMMILIIIILYLSSEVSIYLLNL